MAGREWMKDAKCRGQDPKLWDIDHVGLTRKPLIDYSREVCEGCPVLAQCAAAALRNDDRGVIMAGEPLSGHLQRKTVEERLQHVILHGTHKQSYVRNHKSEATIKSQKKAQLTRKMNRWESRVCIICEVPLKPEGLPDDVWPERTVAHNLRFCPACAQQKEDGRNRDKALGQRIGRWEYCQCSECSAALKPTGMPDDVWPERVLAKNSTLCVSCADMADMAAEAQFYETRIA